MVLTSVLFYVLVAHAGFFQVSNADVGKAVKYILL